MRVSILATNDTFASPIVSIYDIMNKISELRVFDDAVPEDPPYDVEIVAERDGIVMTASQIPIAVNHAIASVDRTDMVVIPSIATDTDTWQRGKHSEIAAWIRDMHEAGSMICTTCSGVFLLAESGLLDGKEATMHWSHARAFERAFPDIKLSLEKILLSAGGRSELVMSGASTSWQDLVLYLVARQLGYPVAYAVAKFFAIQWHSKGQAPLIVFTPPLDHGDAAVLEAQQWLSAHYPDANTLDSMISVAGLSERSFKRRFVQATGLTPVQYVQHLRVDHGKRWLERSNVAVDEIAWKVGYQDPAFFRRLFKRLTGMTPSAYRKTFTLPKYESI